MKKLYLISDQEFESIKHFFTIRKVLKNQYLIQQGDEAKYEYIIMSGIFRVFYLDENGKEHIEQFATENWWMSDYIIYLYNYQANKYVLCMEQGDVLQLNLLNREVFIAIWIALFGVLSLYLIGKITLPHDSPLPFISIGRLLFGLTIVSFTISMIPGFWGVPLKLIEAFPPPLKYLESPFVIGTPKTNIASISLPSGANIGVHVITAFNNYKKGLAYPKKVNKPIMLDFTGNACVNCREMENNVWSDGIILKILKQDVVLIS
ncbi:Cyclic nucleotide-binding domain [Flavobacteriaceae bacterium]